MAFSEIQPQRFETLKAVLNYFYPDNTRSGSHFRHNIKYHLVWIPKYRREVLVGRIPVRLKEILEEVARSYKLKIIAHEVMPDHVHHSRILDRLYLCYFPVFGMSYAFALDNSIY